MRGLRAVFVLGALAACGCGRRTPSLPPTMLWAWDRPEDLRFLGDRPDVGVAYLAATIDISGAHVSLRRRHSALQLAPTNIRLPVVRLEPDLRRGATLDNERRALITRMIVAETERAGLGRVQLDFEATASQRDFYRTLLADLRTALGPRARISITALGSWCVGDRWMRELPVDEIVPMFYRLGAEGAPMRADLARGRDVASECRGAHGYATDEPAVPPPTPRRAYLFSPRPWSAEAFARLEAALRGRS